MIAAVSTLQVALIVIMLAAIAQSVELVHHPCVKADARRRELADT